MDVHTRRVTCGRLQGQVILESPTQWAEPDVQVEEPAVPVLVFLGQTSKTQPKPPAHILHHPDRPAEGRVAAVAELQDRTHHHQVHCVLPPQRLPGQRSK